LFAILAVVGAQLGFDIVNEVRYQKAQEKLEKAQEKLEKAVERMREQLDQIRFPGGMPP